MKDFVLVQKGLEEEFIARSKELGWEGVVLLYKYAKKEVLPKFEGVETGWFLDSEVSNDFSGVVVVALGTKFSRLPKGVTHVVGNEFEGEKDFIHQRRSGLNHVFLNEFKGKVLFSFSGLQNAEHSFRASVVGRMMQNSCLTEFSVVSLASSVSQMRALGDVKAFSRILERKNL
jgi:hypothetical protein